MIKRNEQPIPVAAPSKAWVWSRSLAGIVGSNPAGGMDVCLLCTLHVVRSLRRADHSSRGVLQSVVCQTKCDREYYTMRRPRSAGGCWTMVKEREINTAN